MHTGSWWENLREGDSFEDSGVNERIILKWIFRTLNGAQGLDRSDSRQGQIAGFVILKRNRKKISSIAEGFLVSQEGLCFI